MKYDSPRMFRFFSVLLLLIDVSVSGMVLTRFNQLQFYQSLRSDDHRVAYIVGGQPVLPGEISYQVSIQHNGRHFCGGTIIDDYWIMTAGHCVALKNFTNGMWKIRYNSIHQQSGGSLLNISKIVLHPGYVSWTFENDIALIRTDKPMAGIQKGVLPPLDRTALPVGTPLLISGWGFQHEKGSLVPDLLKTTILSVDRETCNSTFIELDPDRVICAGIDDGSQDGCQGDSGGPASAGVYIEGVVSIGFGCGRKNTPGAYTRVSYYRQWIRDETGL